MKSYRRSDRHDYIVKYLTHDTNRQVNNVHIKQTLASLDDIFDEYLVGLTEKDYPTEIVSIEIDGKLVGKDEINKINSKFFSVDECDGGGAVGGDGGSGAPAGDAGGSSSVGDVGDVAGEMNGITTAEVLGTNKSGQGFFGKDNFYIPSRVKFPLHRYQLANGGSVRKKTKSGKPKKYDYEKGMKVVVDMFEDEKPASEKTLKTKSGKSYTKKQIMNAIEYWKNELNKLND